MISDDGDLAAALSRQAAESAAFDEQQRRARVASRWTELKRELGPLSDATIKRFRRYADPEQRRSQDRVLNAVGAFAERLEFEVATGRSVGFYGLPGCGKDHLLAALGRVALLKYGISVTFRDMARVLMDAREHFRRDEAKIARELCAKQVLIFADFFPVGRELEPREREFLKLIIDERARDRRPIWWSANIGGEDQFRELAGDLIGRRIWAGAFTQHFDWAEFGSPAARLMPDDET